MSSTKPSGKTEPKTKKFGKGQRTIPHHTQKARKFYPAEIEAKPKKVRKSIREAKLRPSLVPGAVLILLAGRFRGKKVIFLKHLSQGVLLVTGPFRVNGVPLRRVNHKYVIVTKNKVELKGIDDKVLEKVGQEGYFTKDKAQKKSGEDKFFSQGEKPEKKEVSSTRASDQKSVDKAILQTLGKESLLKDYLATTFSLRSGDRPHEMVF
ncbi:uncharacterized protein KY384_002232 [Bacidia gigantensis]|uniref:uncharacterized protein n=1 Tax=Bacidia gigantensis TaxID=2732470 RepID=UPI001D03BEF3|nr:uncharacterized protein KY384_002232 [Bacidia gigantensis]KAG8533449.1 hypothetical protein KY384_002232 [Bacidia gigantensis]